MAKASGPGGTGGSVGAASATVPVGHAADGGEGQLPASLRTAVRQEFARARRPPYETFVTVAVNGALMSSAWFLLPSGLKDKVFTLHGTLAFGIVLAAWMYSDVPSTNVLGPDAVRVVSALAMFAATTSARMRSACIAPPEVSMRPNRFKVAPPLFVPSHQVPLGSEVSARPSSPY